MRVRRRRDDVHRHRRDDDAVLVVVKHRCYRSAKRRRGRAPEHRVVRESRSNQIKSVQRTRARVCRRVTSRPSPHSSIVLSRSNAFAPAGTRTKTPFRLTTTSRDSTFRDPLDGQNNKIVPIDPSRSTRSIGRMGDVSVFISLRPERWVTFVPVGLFI